MKAVSLQPRAERKTHTCCAGAPPGTVASFIVNTHEPTSAILAGCIASRGSVRVCEESGRGRSDDIVGRLAPAVVDSVQVAVESKVSPCARRAARLVWLLLP